MNIFFVSGKKFLVALIQPSLIWTKLKQILKESDPEFNLNITVHRFLDDWHNCYYLWPDEEFRSQAIAIWFQMQEAVFKTRFYEFEVDTDGTKMTEYEDLGDKLKWKHNES